MCPRQPHPPSCGTPARCCVPAMSPPHTSPRQRARGSLWCVAKEGRKEEMRKKRNQTSPTRLSASMHQPGEKGAGGRDTAAMPRTPEARSAGVGLVSGRRKEKKVLAAIFDPRNGELVRWVCSLFLLRGRSFLLAVGLGRHAAMEKKDFWADILLCLSWLGRFP